MYDHSTKSLWSTLKGEPVVGELVGRGIKLKRESPVTTTWGEWKRRHPDTAVLSLDTGHKRDYGEGVAYREYFASDELMFSVPHTDERLRNKDEVLALREGSEQLAISADFLERHPVFQGTVGRRKFVVLTDQSGANRVYEAGEFEFATWDAVSIVTDSESREWTMTSSSLNSSGRQLRRLPAHRAFWFGWHAQFPKTRLIK